MSKKALDSYESEILEAFESGKTKQTPNMNEEIKRYQSYAQNTLKKDKRVNIRMSEHDLEAIQRRAIQEGIPYQTLISSLIHKYVVGG